jgi:phosphoenolpyruvate carboxykinase (GTP)
MAVLHNVSSNLSEKIKNKELVQWIDEMASLCGPDSIVLIDGSEEQKKDLEKQALESGEILQLNQENWPGCYYHRSAINDVARVEDKTFICTTNKEDAGPNNNWMTPKVAYAKASEYFKESMKGRTMYVIPFSMGTIGSPFSKICIQLTDSIYVVLNQIIMTRVSSKILDILGEHGKFTKGLHSKADLDDKKRLILHFPEDNAIWSVGSGYGGNVLLGKKCLALRIASFLGQQEGWLAEHMLIVGIQGPNGDTKYIAGAFPSACGKTNLAMLNPPKEYAEKGYKIWTVGDDIAWMRIKDGRLYAVNPEAGYFGVVPGTNTKTNPNAMKTISKNTIFTNVLLSDDMNVWWEDGEGNPPAKGTSWDGKPWTPDAVDEKGNKMKGSHPNARFTTPAFQNPVISPEWENPEGVPISAILFGTRRESVVPLIYEAFNWQHGVYVGATMASERTAAQVGKLGEVRRDPMAMLPFCGYNMGDYFNHWLEMGKKLEHPPMIFHVNWFRRDENRKFLWPGFGDNLRIIEWILARVEGKADVEKSPIGNIPTKASLNLDGLNIDEKKFSEIFKIDKTEWAIEAKDHIEYLSQFKERLPKELMTENENLQTRLK